MYMGSVGGENKQVNNAIKNGVTINYPLFRARMPVSNSYS